MKIFRWVKSNLIYLVALFLLTFFLFKSLLNYDLEVRDWFVLGYFCTDFGTGSLLFKFPPSYYLSQYGITHVSIQVLRELFGYNTLGYNLISIFSRMIASASIYLFVNKWTGRKLAAFLSGIIFFVSYAGIETSTWVSHYTNYLSVPALLASLYYWRKASEKPTARLIEISLIITVLAIIYAHLRIFALPLILAIASVYYFIFYINKRKDWELRKKHFIGLIVTIVIFYMFTQFFKQIPAISTKIPSLQIMILFLVTGAPPVIHSLFLFWGNLLLPPPVVGAFIYPILGKVGLDPVLIFLSLTTFLSLSFLFFLIVKRSFKLVILSLIPIFYPISIYLSQKSLIGWPGQWIITTMVGGTVPVIIVIFGLYLWKRNRNYSELILVGALISILHLLVPWLMFHILEGNEQSAFSFNSRYYVVPMAGILISLGAVISLIWSEISHPTIGLKWFLKCILLTPLFLVMIFMFIPQAVVLNNEITNSVRSTDPARHQELWYMLYPYFSTIEDKQRKTLVYIEANEIDKSIIIYRMPYQFDCEGFRMPAIGPSVAVFSDKKEFVSLIQQSNESMNILAFKIDGDRVVDIKNEILPK